MAGIAKSGRFLVCVESEGGWWRPDAPALVSYRVARMVGRDYEHHWHTPRNVIIIDLEHWAGVENAIVYQTR